ncbi:MAG: Gfo/Idh/MocA family oxidoreductase [Planctomycetes bacterium]|nr:Gfo/Idh/MocA family oxidoreductase [Planctomycetota bacterium]
MDRVRVGIIGCGNISSSYLTNARKFPILEVMTLADLDVERAKARAREFSVPKACSVAELLADETIEIVINLTIPAVHAEVALQCIAAGKHVISEKPLAVTREDGKKVLAAAKKAKLRVGGAPDTFLGAGHQLARKLLDDGAIGRPVAATAYMMSHGHESWHPDPEFYYKPGGGPMFDMGPYYITDLLQILGPARRVSGIASIAIPERTITSKPKHGTKIKVETPDHVTGNIEFENGCIATVITSFATWYGQYYSPITIFGTEGTLMVPDPNGFDGEVKVWRNDKHQGKEFQPVPFVHRLGYGRSVGAADMAYAIRSGRPHRASGEQAYATLDIMEGFLDASRTGKNHVVKAKYDRPAPLPPGLAEGVLDE